MDANTVSSTNGCTVYIFIHCIYRFISIFFMQGPLCLTNMLLLSTHLLYSFVHKSRQDISRTIDVNTQYGMWWISMRTPPSDQTCNTLITVLESGTVLPFTKLRIENLTFIWWAMASSELQLPLIKEYYLPLLKIRPLDPSKRSPLCYYATANWEDPRQNFQAFLRNDFACVVRIIVNDLNTSWKWSSQPWRHALHTLSLFNAS